jgi:hypothetical protein
MRLTTAILRTRHSRQTAHAHHRWPLPATCPAANLARPIAAWPPLQQHPDHPAQTTRVRTSPYPDQRPFQAAVALTKSALASPVAHESHWPPSRCSSHTHAPAPFQHPILPPRVRPSKRPNHATCLGPHRPISTSGKCHHRPPLFCHHGQPWTTHLTTSPPPCTGPRAPPRLGAALGTDVIDPRSLEHRHAGAKPPPRSPFGELHHQHFLVPFSWLRCTPGLSQVMEVPSELSSTAVSHPFCWNATTSPVNHPVTLLSSLGAS